MFANLTNVHVQSAFLLHNDHNQFLIVFATPFPLNIYYQYPGCKNYPGHLFRRLDPPFSSKNPTSFVSPWLSTSVSPEICILHWVMSDLCGPVNPYRSPRTNFCSLCHELVPFHLHLLEQLGPHGPSASSLVRQQLFPSVATLVGTAHAAIQESKDSAWIRQ